MFQHWLRITTYSLPILRLIRCQVNLLITTAIIEELKSQEITLEGNQKKSHVGAAE